jgi:hypothetical protein
MGMSVHIMTCLQTPRMPAAPAVLRLIAPGALAADRDIAILRLLGRLEFATTAMLQALVAPDLSAPALRAAEPPPRFGPNLAADGEDGAGAAAGGRRARPAPAPCPPCMA